MVDWVEVDNPAKETATVQQKREVGEELEECCVIKIKGKGGSGSV